MAMTCRHYGVTRQSFYVWKRRNDELGEEGQKGRSRRPKTSGLLCGPRVVSALRCR
jgi:Helix-turn-helix domain